MLPSLAAALAAGLGLAHDLLDGKEDHHRHHRAPTQMKVPMTTTGWRSFVEMKSTWRGAMIPTTWDPAGATGEFHLDSFRFVLLRLHRTIFRCEGPAGFVYARRPRMPCMPAKSVIAAGEHLVGLIDGGVHEIFTGWIHSTDSFEGALGPRFVAFIGSWRASLDRLIIRSVST